MCSRFGIMLMLYLQNIDASPTADIGAAFMDVLVKPYAVKTANNSRCLQHSMKYEQAFKVLQPWALRMYDSSSHIPSGALEGNIQQLGNYDQCLAVNAGDFHGQYCSIAVQFTINKTMDFFKALINASDVEWEESTTTTYNWAFCVPSSCEHEDLEEDMNRKLSILEPSRIKVNCHQNQKWSFNAAEIVMLVVIAITGLLLISSTCYDLIIQYNIDTEYGTIERLLLCFSMYKNGRTLMGLQNTSKDQIACLHGMRFLSIVWIVFGHTYYMMTTSPNINLLFIKYIDRDLSKMILMNGTLATDTFFLVGGIVLAYSFLRSKERGLPFNIGIFYLHRYNRLTVPYAFIVFFYATLLYHMGSGPLWDKVVGENRDNCIYYWWTNLLYINNYVGVDRMCVNQTWYLSMDMQLYWLSPLLLLPLYRWPQHRYKVLSGVITLSVFIPFFVTYNLRLTAAMLYNKDQIMLYNVYKEMYLKVYTRMGPYIVGIMMGFILYSIREEPLCISRKKVLAAWLTMIVVSTTVLLGVYRFYQPGYKYSVLEAAMYAALYRTAWAMCMAWVVFACVNGYGGAVNAVLSCKMMVPFSNLTYCVYLCHYIVLYYKKGTTRSPGFVTDFRAIQEFCGNIFISLMLAALISLAYEYPFINLDKMLVQKIQAWCTMHENETAEAEPAVYVITAQEDWRVQMKNLIYEERVDSRERLQPEAANVAEKSEPVCARSDTVAGAEPKSFDNSGYV